MSQGKRDTDHRQGAVAKHQRVLPLGERSDRGELMVISKAKAQNVLSGAGIALVLIGVAALALATARASASLPDNRAYEVLTPTDKNAANPGVGVPSTDGSA